MSQRELNVKERQTIEEACQLIAPHLVRIGTYLTQAVQANLEGRQVDTPLQKLYESLTKVVVAFAESGHFD